LQWIKRQSNGIYARRDEIEPLYTSKAGLKVRGILKLLPMTNCKVCGLATCMAYAAALREWGISLPAGGPSRKKSTGKNAKNSNPSWRASVGGLWRRIEDVN